MAQALEADVIQYQVADHLALIWLNRCSLMVMEHFATGVATNSNDAAGGVAAFRGRRTLLDRDLSRGRRLGR